MRMTKRLRMLVVAVGIGASVLAIGARPTMAAGVETGTATWLKVYGLQEGISPMSCDITQKETTADWSCNTNAGPLLASGADCTEDTYVDAAVVGQIKVDLPGCTASLSISSWPGKAVCTTTSAGTTCNGEMADGSGTFTFQPVVGSPLLPQSAIISDAACSPAGGHATVTSAGTFAMSGTITWTGSCSTINLLFWRGSVTIV